MPAATAGRAPALPARTETSDAVPQEVARLLSIQDEDAREAAWQDFVERYSRLLLRVSFDFAPGYDGAMDRYAFILEELRRDGYRRLRRFSADGRGRFSTWLAVVARRLCLDHHRIRYGRTRRAGAASPGASVARLARRSLADLTGCAEDFTRLRDTLQADPGEEVSEAERREALQQAFAGLPPQDQLLLKLRFEEELSARQIAVVLRMPTPFHVYRRLRWLLAGLRGRLRMRGFDPI